MGAHKKSRKSGKSLRFLFFVVIILTGVVSVQISNLYLRDLQLQKEEAALRHQIQLAQQEQADLANYKVYMGTDAYVEELAREKFGLIMPDEILYKSKGE